MVGYVLLVLLCVGFFVGVLTYAIMWNSRDDDKRNSLITNDKKALDEIINTLNISSVSIVEYHAVNFGIVLNDNSKHLVIVNNSIEDQAYSKKIDWDKNSMITHSVISYYNMINVEVVIDESAVMTPSIGCAIIGGVLFGGAGAIIGALNAKINKQINSIVLRLYTDDIKSPIHDLLFFASSTPVSIKSSQVKTQLNLVNEWYGRLLTIIEKRQGSLVFEN